MTYSRPGSSGTDATKRSTMTKAIAATEPPTRRPMTTLLDHAKVEPPPLRGTYIVGKALSALHHIEQHEQAHKNAKRHGKTKEATDPVHVSDFLHELAFHWLQRYKQPDQSHCSHRNLWRKFNQPSCTPHLRAHKLYAVLSTRKPIAMMRPWPAMHL